MHRAAFPSAARKHERREASNVCMGDLVWCSHYTSESPQYAAWRGLDYLMEGDEVLYDPRRDRVAPDHPAAQFVARPWTRRGFAAIARHPRARLAGRPGAARARSCRGSGRGFRPGGTREDLRDCLVSQSAGEHEGFLAQRRTIFEVRSPATGRHEPKATDRR